MTQGQTNPATDIARSDLKAAVRILENWGATSKQGAAILGINTDTFLMISQQESPKDTCVDDETFTRASMILNLHATLRIMFDNPHNIYGFMGMANHNEFFQGRPPLEVMACGDFRSLDETYRRIHALPGAW